MNNVKVLHLITGLGSGGAEMMLYKLLSRMDRTYFNNVVVSMTDTGVLGHRIEALGIRVLTLNMRRGLLSPAGLLRFWRLLRREKPHVLQSWLYHADLLGLIGGRLARVSAIAWNLRCSDVETRYYFLLRAFVIPLLTRLSSFPNVVLVNSQVGKKFHTKLGYHPQRWEVISNGFDLDAFRPNPEARIHFRKKMNLPEETHLIGLIARYDPMKDHLNFLQAAQYLLIEHPATRFILIGRGVDPRNNGLNKIIHDLNIEQQVHLLGEQADLENIMPALDIVSLSSAFGEGFPNVIGEAMACGVPCVATDVGDSALIVGETGRIVPPRNPHALAAAWQDLIKRGPEYQDQLGSAARRRIEERYDLPQIVKRYEEIYEELAADVRF